MNNRFINQLEEEIVKSFPLVYVLETKDYALKLNSFEKDVLIRCENKDYINRLVDTYLTRFNGGI